MEESELVADALGEHVFEYFIRNKRQEWRDYKSHVSPGRSAAISDRHEHRTLTGLSRPTAPAARADPRPRRSPVEGGRERVDRDPGASRADGWAGAVVCADEDPEGAFGICRSLRKRDSSLEPVLLLVTGAQLTELELREDLFDDFCLTPFHQKELEARLRHLFWRTGRGSRPEIVEYGDLVLNLETYQAALSGRPLDLTYMEYELLKFFSTHSGKVFTREQLLSRVWGYEYYGGARTVDVHVRRLRAKLGEEHANLIQTVRSVGYRFGSPRWAPAAGSAAALGSARPSVRLGRRVRRRGRRRRPREEAHHRAPDRAAEHDRDREQQQHDHCDDDPAGGHGRTLALHSAAVTAPNVGGATWGVHGPLRRDLGRLPRGRPAGRLPAVHRVAVPRRVRRGESQAHRARARGTQGVGRRRSPVLPRGARRVPRRTRPPRRTSWRHRGSVGLRPSHPGARGRRRRRGGRVPERRARSSPVVAVRRCHPSSASLGCARTTVGSPTSVRRRPAGAPVSRSCRSTTSSSRSPRSNAPRPRGSRACPSRSCSTTRAHRRSTTSGTSRCGPRARRTGCRCTCTAVPAPTTAAASTR